MLFGIVFLALLTAEIYVAGIAKLKYPLRYL